MYMSDEFKKGIKLVIIIEAIILFGALCLGDDFLISLTFWGMIIVDIFVAICYLIMEWLTKY